MDRIAPSGRGDRATKDESGAPLKIYEGTRTGPHRGVVRVVVGELTVDGRVVNTRPLPLRLDLYTHSPDGFEWGYGGSGPSQLALALCADALGDDRRALGLYQHFKWQHVAKFPQAGWRLTEEQIVTDVRLLEGDPV